MEDSTTILQAARTIGYVEGERSEEVKELYGSYSRLTLQEKLGWTEHLRLKRLLGSGGQGLVFLSERRGSDGFTLPVALKFFSPERFEDVRTYEEAMKRMAQVNCRIAKIQHDNLLDVQNFIERNRIRILEMEWVDGYDLESLLTTAMLERARGRVSSSRWDYINNVVVTQGPLRPRLKAGIAVAIVHGVLAGLAALHRDEVVHGDIKPSNIMVKRTGHPKIIDIGSAVELDNLPPQRTCTPQYVAPEILDREHISPRSDLASVGYVLVELLSGRPLFAGATSFKELIKAKRTLPQRLEKILPAEVADSELLMTICQRLTSPDPMLRYASAEEALTGADGLSEFHRSLIRGDLASEYENEIRVWLEELD